MGYKKKLFVALAIVAAKASAHISGGHDCMHDDPAFLRAMYSTPLRAATADDPLHSVVEMSRVPPSAAGRRGAVEGPDEIYTIPVIKMNQTYEQRQRRAFGASAARQPIRILFRSADLDKNGKYCASNGQNVPDYLGGTLKCTAADILASQHVKLLRTVVLPEIDSLFTRILSVDPLEGSLNIPSNYCGGQYSIPAADTDPGVENYDLVVYVSAAPADSASTVAWASMCGTVDGRPAIARINFAPKFLFDPDVNVLRVAIHELIHALGFSGPYISSQLFGQQNIVSSGHRRPANSNGQPVTLYNGFNALAAARTAFSCETLDGIEFENAGGSGTAGSHWERRTHKEDVMCGIIGNTMALSAMTFGLLEDSGHYNVDHSHLETDFYMRDAGCGVFTEKCNTVAGGAGSYFCNNIDSPLTNLCSWDYKSIGQCQFVSGQSLPVWAQYFPSHSGTAGSNSNLMDFCPIVAPYSNRECSNYQNTNANNTNIGNYYGSDGRCFPTTPTLFKGNTASNNGAARCFQARCPDGTRVEFLVGDSEEWTECPLDGSAGIVDAPSPYTGQITCPEASRFCTHDLWLWSENTTTTTSPPRVTMAPTTTLPPISKALFVHLAEERSDQNDFILALRSFYNISEDGQVVKFLRWATTSETEKMLEEFANSSSSTAEPTTTSPAAARGFYRMADEKIAAFGFGGSEASNAADQLVIDVDADANFSRHELGVLAVKSISVVLALNAPNEGFSGALGLLGTYQIGIAVVILSLTVLIM